MPTTLIVVKGPTQYKNASIGNRVMVFLFLIAKYIVQESNIKT